MVYNYITVPTSILLMFLMISLSVVPGFAEDLSDSLADDPVIDGFDDFSEDFGDTFVEDTGEDSSDDTDISEEKKDNVSLPFDVNGSISVEAAYNYSHSSPEPGQTDWRGFSKLKPELNLDAGKTVSDRFRYFISGKVSYDLIYRIQGKDDYTDEVIEDYEIQAEIEKAYIQVKLSDSLDLKAGRQIVVWGKSDTIRVVDILNPLDIREPGLTDIEDLRMPLVMTRLDYYLTQWSFSSVFIHEIRFDKLPVWGSDFYPTSSPLPYEKKPESSFGNTEYALSASRFFNGGDVAFYYADVFNDNFHIESVSGDSPPLYDPYLDHSRITMVGSDVNLALGNWLLKSEVAYIHDIAYYNPAGNDGPVITRGTCPLYDRYDVLFGFEYMGIDDTVINIDTVVRYIGNYDEQLELIPSGPDETETQWALRTSRTFMNETLTIELLASVYEWNGDGGAYERFTIDYDVSDTIETRSGIMIYQSGNRTGFESIGNNDRIFFELEYSF